MHPSPRLETSRKKRRIQSEDQRAVKGWARQKAKNNIAVLSCTWYGRRALGWLRMTRGYDRLWQRTDRQARPSRGSSSTLHSPSSNILIGTKQLSNHILITPKLNQSLKLLFLHAYAYCPKVQIGISDERTVLGQVYGGHWTGSPMIMTRSRLARRILPLIRTAVPQSHQELYDRISGQVRTAVKGGVVDKPCNGHDITSRTARHHSGNFGLCKRLQV